jgi:hypothetical protein
LDIFIISGWYKLLNFLLRHNIETLKTKFIGIYLLNVLDIIFTLILLKTGIFVEANSIMRSVIGNEVLSVGIKTLVPLILLFIVFLRMQKATDKQLILSNIIINACLILYILIDIFHCVWCLLYLTLIL